MSNLTYTEDFIVEQGIDGIWNYRKWESGIAECWCKYTRKDVLPSEFVSWESLYVTDIVNNESKTLQYPIEFIEPPVEFARTGNSVYAIWIDTHSNGNPTITHTGRYKAIRPKNPTANSDLELDIITYGRWK